jgi:hypothetical protein
MEGTIRRTLLFIDINLSFYNRNYLWSQRLIDKSSTRLLVLMDHFYLRTLQAGVWCVDILIIAASQRLSRRTLSL